MKSIETEMRKRLKKKLKIAIKLKKLKLIRLETGGTEIGVPDLYFWTPNSRGWIELKQVEIKSVRREISVPFRSGQLPFIRDASLFRDNVILLIEVRVEKSTLWFFVLNENIKEEYSELAELYTCSLLLVDEPYRSSLSEVLPILTYLK